MHWSIYSSVASGVITRVDVSRGDAVGDIRRNLAAAALYGAPVVATIEDHDARWSGPVSWPHLAALLTWQTL